MDVNGTGFHLLLGRADWEGCTLGPEIRYDRGRDELTLTPQPFTFAPPPRELPLPPSARRGADRDRYGSWYQVAQDRSRLLVTSSGAGDRTQFWPVPDQPPAAAYGGFGALSAPAEPAVALSGAAVTEDDYLVVGCAAPPGLLVFDLIGGGAPDRLHWDVDTFAPHDIAARPGGGVVVLDRQARRYWQLDRSLRIMTRTPAGDTDDFAPMSGPPREGVRPAPPGRDAAVPVEADSIASGADPVAIECCPDGTVLVLFQYTGGSAIRAYRDGAPLGTAVRLPAPGAAGASLTGHDLAVLAPNAAGAPLRLFVSEHFGDQVYEFALSLGVAIVVTPQLRYLPMRRHGGQALVAAAGQVWYDSSDWWVALAEHPRRRYATRGVVVTDVFDGAEAETVWHRLMIDAVLPPETAVQVESAAADDDRMLSDAPPWQSEPRPYVRGSGSELPFVDDGGYRTLELAFQQARGRYLRLRLTLIGNGRATPRIRALRAHFPRFSYLDRYLPAVYREDAGSASFLDRWLANVEGMATDLEGRIAAVQLLFDPRTAPAEALEWLGGWFQLAMDPAWDQSRRRLLLSHAMTFFAWRGTLRGLRTALALVEPDPDSSIFTDAASRCAQRIRIVELFRTKVTPAVALGDPTQAAGGTPLAGAWWSLSRGAQVLHEAYGQALADAGLPVPPGTPVPVVAPGDPAESAVWSRFTAAAFGFVPEPIDPQTWRDFLVRRYAGRAGLRTDYGVGSAADVQALQPPSFLPDADAVLRDWYQVQAVVLRSRHTAHRFRVLLPVPIGAPAPGTDVAGDRLAQLALARRIVQLEKPAHTVFDVRFYWDAFRLGEARLELDTLVDLGSRSPLLLRPTVLDEAHLGENVLPRPDLERRVLDPDGRCQ
jgi:phage tail-like protein